MGVGADAALEDQAQISSGQAQSDRELEAGHLMKDSRFWFHFVCDWVLVLTHGTIFRGVVDFLRYTRSFCVTTFLSTIER